VVFSFPGGLLSLVSCDNPDVSLRVKHGRSEAPTDRQTGVCIVPSNYGQGQEAVAVND
jgi:hypothetical protein